MNASETVREDGAVGTTVASLAVTAGGGMQDDIGDLDANQVQELAKDSCALCGGRCLQSYL